jgi:hypothetical protein
MPLLLSICDVLNLNAILTVLLKASHVFIYRNTEEGSTKRLRPFVFHVRPSTNHNPLLERRVVRVSEVIWAPFFVVFVALQGVYKSRKPPMACEVLTLCFRQITAVSWCCNLPPSRRCNLNTLDSTLCHRGRLEVLRPACYVLHWSITHSWSFLTDCLSFVMPPVQIMLVHC